MERKKIGKLGEDRAVEWLQYQGFNIEKRNIFWCKHEIDILATKNHITYLFEVKTVHNMEFLKITSKQRMAYETYILKHLVNKAVQCYVIVVNDKVHMIPMEL